MIAASSSSITDSFHNYVEEEIPVIRKLLGAAAAALLLVSSFAHAEIPWTLTLKIASRISSEAQDS